MPDKYRNFSELARAETEGKDYRIIARLTDCPILIAAPHGGGIEPYTSELASEIAGSDLSFYSFEGIKETGNSKLHITSHHFDEPIALMAASQAQVVVAVHGHHERQNEFTLIGGCHDRLCEKLKRALNISGFTAQAPPFEMAALNLANICNRGGLKMGVQLELSRALREKLREDASVRRRFVQGIRALLIEEL